MTMSEGGAPSAVASPTDAARYFLFFVGCGLLCCTLHHLQVQQV